MSSDRLPSWRAGPAKQSILEYVTAVTDRDSPDAIAADVRRIIDTASTT